MPSEIRVNMLKWRLSSERHPRSKNGFAPHSTTGVASASWIHRNGPSPSARISGWPGSMSDIEINNSGTVSAVLTQKRRVMSTSSGLGGSSDATAARGYSGARPQRHPTYRTIPRMVPDVLGMHRADVLDRCGRRRRDQRLERHPALGTRAGRVGAYLGMHRTGVDGRGGGLARLHGVRRVHRIARASASGGEIFRRLGDEFRATSLGAEVVSLAVVDVRVAGGRRIDLHPAYRVACINLRRG